MHCSALPCVFMLSFLRAYAEFFCLVLLCVGLLLLGLARLCCCVVLASFLSPLHLSCLLTCVSSPRPFLSSCLFCFLFSTVCFSDRLLFDIRSFCPFLTLVGRVLRCGFRRFVRPCRCPLCLCLWRGLLEIGNLARIFRYVVRTRRVGSYIIGLLNNAPFSADLGLVDRMRGMWIQHTGLCWQAGRTRERQSCCYSVRWPEGGPERYSVRWPEGGPEPDIPPFLVILSSSFIVNGPESLERNASGGPSGVGCGVSSERANVNC